MTRSILPEMYEALAKGSGNLAIGTRVSDGVGDGSLSPARQALSDMGAWFFRRIAGAAVTDPMSGFFMIRREIVSRLAPRLSPDGFKILVDIILSAGGGLKIVEVPYVFRKRNAGESKLTPLVAIDFLGLVVHHATGGVSADPICIVCLDWGESVWSSISWRFRRFFTGPERWTSTRGNRSPRLLAMASNFILNNEITYRVLSLPGLSLVAGFVAFASGMQRRGARQYRRRFVAVSGQSDLVGRRARGRVVERRLELCGEHESHLATGSPRLRFGEFDLCGLRRFACRSQFRRRASRTKHIARSSAKFRFPKPPVRSHLRPSG